MEIITLHFRIKFHVNHYFMKEALVVTYRRGAFTLDVKDYSVESPNTTVLAIKDLKPSYP
jgi:hypothetical protein